MERCTNLFLQQSGLVSELAKFAHPTFNMAETLLHKKLAKAANVRGGQLEVCVRLSCVVICMGILIEPSRVSPVVPVVDGPVRDAIVSSSAYEVLSWVPPSCPLWVSGG